MAVVMRMPKMSDTMQKGTISSWLKKVGDEIKSGTVLAEIETDKATMELEAEEDGFILYLGANEKEDLKVNSILAIIGNKGEDITNLITENSSQVNKETINNEQSSKKENSSNIPEQQIVTSNNSTTESRLFVSPLAKRIAQEQNIDLKSITGSGENGRIIKKDLNNVSIENITVFQNTTQNLKESYRDIPTNSIRTIIAKRLSQSKQLVPHFYLNMSINMDKAVDMRPDLNENSSTKISFNDIIIRAAAMAIRKHTAINSSFYESFVRNYDHISIGVAMAIEDTLVVPVIKFADKKSLFQISSEIKMLQTKASTRKLTPSDMQGGTFTISNLGMYGIESFSAIINAPEACILAIGAIEQLPIIKKDKIEIGHIMKVTLSCDHRVIDGAIGAAFLQTFKNLLEHPHLLLL